MSATTVEDWFSEPSPTDAAAGELGVNGWWISAATEPPEEPEDITFSSAVVAVTRPEQIDLVRRFECATHFSFDEVAAFLTDERARMFCRSLGERENYETFLNGLGKAANLDEIELFWIEHVRVFFAGKPFKLRVDASLSIRAAIRDLLAQAKARQLDIPGSRYEGAMLQHLIGAKLEIVLGDGKIEHHSSSEADQAEGRSGDFTYGDVAIHVTTNPGEGVVRKCSANLDNGLRPLIITTSARLIVAESLADDAGIKDRIDVLDVEQFLAANLHERSLFSTAGRVPRTEELVRRYNAIIDAVETDPALKIELAATPSAAKRKDGG